jgi:hypothetical protein
MKHPDRYVLITQLNSHILLHDTPWYMCINNTVNSHILLWGMFVCVSGNIRFCVAQRVIFNICGNILLLMNIIEWVWTISHRVRQDRDQHVTLRHMIPYWKKSRLQCAYILIYGMTLSWSCRQRSHVRPAWPWAWVQSMIHRTAPRSSTPY